MFSCATINDIKAATSFSDFVVRLIDALVKVLLYLILTLFMQGRVHGSETLRKPFINPSRRYLSVRQPTL